MLTTQINRSSLSQLSFEQRKALTGRIPHFNGFQKSQCIVWCLAWGGGAVPAPAVFPVLREKMLGWTGQGCGGI